MDTNDNTNIAEKVFKYRLDYYWKSLSIYAILLSIVFLIKVSLSDVKIISAIYEPLIFLLVFFVVITSIALTFQIYNKKTISLNQDRIILSSRNKVRVFNWDKINKIIFIKEKFKKNSEIKLIKVKINKYRIYRINPSYYEHEPELINFFIKINNKYRK